MSRLEQPRLELSNLSLSVITCQSCRHWVDQGPQLLPSGQPNVTQPHQGECRERLRSQGLIQKTAHGPALVAWMSGYPQIPANFPACGQYQQVGGQAEGQVAKPQTPSPVQ